MYPRFDLDNEFTFELLENGIINLVHPTLNRIILQWRAVEDYREVSYGDPYEFSPSFTGLGVVVELVAGSFDSDFADLPVDSAGPIRFGQGVVEVAEGVQTTRRVWCRIRDSVSAAGVITDNDSITPSRIEEGWRLCAMHLMPSWGYPCGMTWDGIGLSPGRKFRKIGL